MASSTTWYRRSRAPEGKGPEAWEGTMLLEDMRCWIRGEHGEAEKVQPVRGPSFELLEARVLLSADPLGGQLSSCLGVALDNEAIVVDLPQQGNQLETAQSPILTVPLADPTRASDGGLAETNLVATASPLPTFPVLSGCNAEAELDTAAVLLLNGSAGPDLTSRQTDSVSCSQALPVEIRGPPTASLDSSSASAWSTVDALASDLLGVDASCAAIAVDSIGEGGARTVGWTIRAARGPFRLRAKPMLWRRTLRLWCLTTRSWSSIF